MKNLVKISDIFTVTYGVNLELANIEQCKIGDSDAIYFVSRTEKNNGVSAIVKRIEGVNPNPGHTLSVAGGGSVLSTFYQPKPYYSGRDLYVLIPKVELSVVQMLFYAYCIQLNKYKYNYGRQANRTLKDILIPEYVPHDFIGIEQDVITSVQDISLKALSASTSTKKKGLTDAELAAKYDTGEKVDFDVALKKMAKAPSKFALAKPIKSKP